MKFTYKELLKFIVCGGVNTLATYGIYLLMLHIVHYVVAYTIAYIAGIVIAYILNSMVVFNRTMSRTKLLQCTLVYMTQYALAQALLYYSIEIFGVGQKIAPLLILLVTIPFGFILNGLVIKRHKRSSQ